MTVTVLDLDTIDHLDFDPVVPCIRCDEHPATYRIRLVCGCIGVMCLRCLAAFKRHLGRLCEVAEFLLAAPWFDCVDCKTRMLGWPIAEVSAL